MDSQGGAISLTNPLLDPDFAENKTADRIFPIKISGPRPTLLDLME